jgi:ATP-dependent DNA helicase DinG
LTTKGYGKLFLASLPSMPRTRELSQVQAFFAPVLNESGEPHAAMRDSFSDTGS